MAEAIELGSFGARPKLMAFGHKQVAGHGGMVVTAFPAASEAGLEILQAGGNAIDAAVAAAWALSVCEPSGSGLGGQTTLLICFPNGKVIVVDGHSFAPAAVSKKLFSRSQQQKGYRACTIPSTPATLGFAQKRYGVLPRDKVMEPAIHLAEHGYAITELQRRQTNWCLADLRASPVAARLFLKKRRPFHTGENFRQKELAATLRCLADRGTKDFYQGQIASAIAEDMKQHGGLITCEDLAGFALPVEREPLLIDYRGYQVVSVPPPAGGLQVLLGLKILGQFAPWELSAQASRRYEILAEATDAVFRERDRLPLYTRDLTPLLFKWLLSDERAALIAEGIKVSCNEMASETGQEEPGETTHLCTADAQGNVVALTQSIQSLFGAKVANGKLGFLYNNYLCTCPRHRGPYQLGSRCIPRSNAAPTLVLRNGSSHPAASGDDRGCERKPFLALGAAGSRRITSAILQVISGAIDSGMSLEQAVGSARVHALPGRKVNIERPAATKPLLKRLEKRFRKVNVRPPHSYFMGAVQAIEFGSDGTLIGVADPRRNGTAAGLKLPSWA